MRNTEYGKTVRYALVDREETLTWLCKRVTEKTGLYCDTGYMCKILAGQKNGTKIKAAINEILELEEN